ncbi:MAG: hypothetical protein ACHQ7M_23450, partial [Chloroflexota bacterium]
VPTVRLVSTFVHNGQAGDVESVMVDGRWIMRDGQHAPIDEADVVSRAEDLARQAWRRLAERFPEVPSPVSL